MMNSESTKHGPYEYDRNAELNDFLHRQQGQPYDRNSDLIGKVYVSREWLEEQQKPGIGLKTIGIWAGLGLTVWLVLVFAGVVLWKVWVG